jgi:predicted porin
MKKFFAAAVLCGTASMAWGQSSVTLYGIVDTGIEYYNNAAKGGSFVGMPSLTGEVPSRFGLRGIEDLGGGYKTFFVLENGFAPDTGALNYGGRLFGRQANVGISSDYGTLTLGRQMNMSMYVLLNADVIGPSIHSMASFDTYLPNARSDNAVGYLGKFDGVTVGGTYSFGRDAAGPAGPSATNCAGQIPGDAVACRQYTAMLAYDAAWGGAAASYDTMYGGPGASAPLVSSADEDKRVIVDGYLKFTGGKIGAGWIRRNTSAESHAQSDIFFVGANYYVTPVLSLDAQALRYILRTQSNSSMLIGRVNYLISKQTTLYSSVGYVFNSPLAANPVAAAGTVPLGSSQLGVMVGIQQRF